MTYKISKTGKIRKEYIGVILRILSIIIAFGMGQLLKHLANETNTTYNGINLYITLVVSILIIAILVAINVKKFNIETLWIKIVMALVYGISIVYAGYGYLFNKSMILVIMASAIYLVDLFITNKEKNKI